MKGTVREKKLPVRGGYRSLLKNIGATIESARNNAVRVINSELVRANWEIGRHIVQFEQRGKQRAEYGSELLNRLSKDLKLRFGKGFSRRNVLDMRRFYLAYPIWQPLVAKLSWTHYTVLLGVSDDSARRFYLKKALEENLSKRELERHVDSSLYERMRFNRSKTRFGRKAKRRVRVVASTDVVKDPYILDFLNISQGHRVTEKALEQKIIDNIQSFLLELGKGFAFVGRQYKISLGRKPFYVDLVFYHRILKCFILIDLKTRSVSHSDIGQMNLYLNYFKQEESAPGDNEPLGLILSAEKDEILVQYAMGGITNKIFVSKYQLYLPDKKQLTSRVKALMPLRKVKGLRGKSDVV